MLSTAKMVGMNEMYAQRTYLSRAEAARYLGVSTATIDRLPVPRSRLGRRVVFAKRDLDSYVRRKKSLVSQPTRPKTSARRQSTSAVKWRAEKLSRLR